MTEKQRRRSSIINPLQMLRRSSPGSRYHSSAGKETNKPKHNIPQSNHRRATDSHSTNVTTSTGTSKRSSLPSLVSRGASSSRGDRRHFSMPLPTPRPANLNHNDSSPSEPQPLAETRKSRLRRLKLRAPRLSAPSSIETTTIARIRLDSNQECVASSKSRSRIRTPTKTADASVYFSKVYQKEGPRSVLSSLGKRYTSLTRNWGKDENRKTMRSDDDMGQSDIIYPECNTQESYYHTVAGTDSLCVPPQTRVDEPLSNPACVESISHTTRSRTMIPIPTSASTPCFDKAEAGYKRHSSFLLSRNGRVPAESFASSRVLSSRLAGEEPTIEEGQNLELGQEHKSMATKVPLRAQAAPKSRILSQSSTEKGPRHSGTFASIYGQTDKMPKQSTDNVGSRKFHLTRSFENMMKSSSVTNQAMLTTRAQPQPDEALSASLSYRRTNHSSTVVSTRTQERSRHRTRTERIIQEPTTKASRAPFTMAQEDNDDDLITPTHSLHQVSKPQPTQYWLGRFVTLINAFHYEDAFNQPDAATGFGMLPSYSSPLGCAEKNVGNYRTKRAFMVLENACVTEEASQSLQVFRDEYIAVKGDRWMD